MPMELYSSDALVRDLVNAISESEGKPLNLGNLHHKGIDRAYAYQLINEAKMAVEGRAPSSQRVAGRKRAAAAGQPVAGPPAAIRRRFMTKSSAPRAPAAPRARAAAKKAATRR